MNSSEDQAHRQNALNELQSIKAELPKADWNQEGRLISKLLRHLCHRFIELDIKCQGQEDPLLKELIKLQSMLSSEPDRENIQYEIDLWVKYSQ